MTRKIGKVQLATERTKVREGTRMWDYLNVAYGVEPVIPEKTYEHLAGELVTW